MTNNSSTAPASVSEALELCDSMVGSYNQFQSISIRQSTSPYTSGLYVCRMHTATADDDSADLASKPVSHSNEQVTCPNGGRGLATADGACLTFSAVNRIVNFCQKMIPVDSSCVQNGTDVLLSESCVRSLQHEQRCIDLLTGLNTTRQQSSS